MGYVQNMFKNEQGDFDAEAYCNNRIQKAKQWSRSYFLRNQKSTTAIYRRYIKSAEKRGIEFELSLHEFVPLLTQPCKYCGDPEPLGIDRIINEEGYKTNNVAPCCTTCNRMKMQHSVIDFIEHCYKISQYAGDKIK